MTTDAPANAPVTPTTEKPSASSITSLNAQPFPAVAVGMKIVTADDSAFADAPILVDKEVLEGQPFVVLKVNTNIDGATIPETGEVCDLVMVAAQAVTLNKDESIAKVGKTVIFVAGNECSVLGQEMQLLEPTNAPVLIAKGLVKKSAQKGDYYTVRGKVEHKADIDLFA